MDLNCDDDTTNSMLVIDGEESTQGPKKVISSQASKTTNYTQSLFNKLPFNKKEAKKAMVVEDDDEEVQDQDGEIKDTGANEELAQYYKEENTESTDQATVNNVLEELNGLTETANNDDE